MSATNSDGFTSDGESDDDSVTSEGEVKMILTADSDLDSDTDNEMDFDYVPTRAYESLGFREIKWDDPRAFVDLQSRIGAFFIGPPEERTTWERTIIDATSDMHRARAYFERKPGNDATLRSGISFDADLGRPKNIPNSIENVLTLAELRHSKAIQQTYNKLVVDSNVANSGPTLVGSGPCKYRSNSQERCATAPTFQNPNHTPSQPTAFGEVQYRFAVTDSVPHTSARATAGVAGWDAFTSLGFYDGRDVGLILWEDRTLVTFPPGSTFFIPAGLLNYSFTAVPDGDMMLLTQTLHNDLYDYVANGFCANPDNLPGHMDKGGAGRA
ncbi:hypothetical protein B0H14DRAFT_3532976 [Mycena olivaceomarginata]|nr:hypothetical protein B0H14DRAFT_3532976 [Mycena olivaceomarginata]